MQEPALDPARPPELPSGRDGAAPDVLKKQAIPEIIARDREVANDPGLMPGLRAASPLAGAQPVTPADRSTEFVPVEGGGDTTSAEALLVAAYLLMWALLLGFVFFTWRRQQRLERRVDELERRPGAPPP